MGAKRNVNAGAGTSGESPIEREALRQRIERRAYFRYCERGCVPGWELADWLAAEQEVFADRASTGTASSGTGEDPLGGRPARRRTRSADMFPSCLPFHAEMFSRLLVAAALVGYERERVGKRWASGRKAWWRWGPRSSPLYRSTGSALSKARSQVSAAAGISDIRSIETR